MERQFRITEVEVGGIDFSVWKIHLKALVKPSVGDEVCIYPDLDIGIRVIPKNTLARPNKTELLGRDENEVSSDEYDKHDNVYVDKRIFREKMGLTNEVKKVGVIIDRGQRMELRGGDLLLIYLSMGGFEK